MIDHNYPPETYDEQMSIQEDIQEIDNDRQLKGSND